MSKRITIWFIVMVFVIPTSAFAIFNLLRAGRDLPVLVEKSPLDSTALLNQDGNPRVLNEFKGKIVVVDFFFTSCGTICPRMTGNFGKLQAKFDKKDVQLLSFTVDPEYDTPAQLLAYAQEQGAKPGQWTFLTGSREDIYRLARRGFRLVATEVGIGSGDFIHTEKFTLLDRGGRVRGYYDGTSDADIRRLEKDIEKLKYEK
jgi:protein SCO1/2